MISLTIFYNLSMSLFIGHKASYSNDIAHAIGGVKISSNQMKASAHSEITNAALRKLLTVASDLAFQYSENGQDAYQNTRRACVELMREGFFERRKSFGPHVEKPPRSH